MTRQENIVGKYSAEVVVTFIKQVGQSLYGQRTELPKADHEGETKMTKRNIAAPRKQKKLKGHEQKVG